MFASLAVYSQSTCLATLDSSSCPTAYSEMASPAKTPKVDDNVVEGFIHNVSPRRQSRRNSPFFSATIQSAREEYHRVVVFAIEKQALFNQAERSGNGVRLRNVRRSLSFSDPHGFDVVCSASTSVEAASLPFLRCAPPDCKKMTVAEVKALGPGQKVGEVRARVRQDGCMSRVVNVNGADCELKELWVSDVTGEIKLTLWDTFVNAAECSKSYSFRNVVTREREGCICLTTGPSSIVEEIAMVEESKAQAEDRRPEAKPRVLLSASFKGIEVTIQRRCCGCHFRQVEFRERSDFHRCESCRLKQASLSFVAVFGGKATVVTEDGAEKVLLTNSALTRYLRDAGLSSLFNDAEAIEDHFLTAPGFDLTVSLDGFLVSVQPAGAADSAAEDQPLAAAELSVDADHGEGTSAQLGWPEDGWEETALP